VNGTAVSQPMHLRFQGIAHQVVIQGRLRGGAWDGYTARYIRNAFSVERALRFIDPTPSIQLPFQ